MSTSLIEMRGISKTYPGAVALRDVDFSLAKGEVRALLGKNGAGKSTLVKILAGIEARDAGTVLMNGKPLTLRSPIDGLNAGIATVHQELSVIPELSVAENLYLGRWPGRAGRIDWRAMNRGARQSLLQLGVDIDPQLPAGRISVAQRQLVEIARALNLGAELIILDEPTSSLVAQEVGTLIGVVRRMAEQGTAIIYISHRMDEIRRVAASITIMRDGREIATRPIDEMSNSEIVEMLLGADGYAAGAQGQEAGQDGNPGPALLELRNIQIAPRIDGASFSVRAGEVLGIAGVLGSGRTELLQAIAGLCPADGGSMVLDGRDYRPRSLRDALGAGVFMTPEDRRHEGAVMMLGVDENLMMGNWGAVSHAGIIQRGKMEARVAGLIRALGIKLARPGEALANLSGGNQQKVVIGKALNAEPRLLLLDEPTRGVDIGAKGQIYQLIRDAARRGLAVVVVSGEIEEFSEVCDRVVVLRGGRIAAEAEGAEIRTDALVEMTTGGTEAA